MAEKELTVFLVDVGARMGHVTGERSISELELGMKYVQDVVATKVFRERKTDLVSLIYVEAETTRNSHNLENICEEFDIVQPFYSHLKRLHPQPSAIEPSSSSAGMVRGLLFTFQKIVAFVGKRKYKKNVVLITNAKTPPELDQDYMDAIVNLVGAAQINITLIGVDFDDDDLTEDERRYKELWSTLFERLPGSKIMGGVELQEYLDQTRAKLVKPTRVFRGELRIGADLADLDYESAKDVKCLTVAVDGFPAVKPDRASSRKVYGLNDDGKPVPMKQETNYEIHNYFQQNVNQEELENNDEEDLERQQFEAVVVKKEELIKGYKYGKSTVVLNPALEEQRVYRSSPALDICGVIELDALPRCYLAGEAVFIVGREGSDRDSMAVGAFVDELTALDSCAIARYVPKSNGEVSMVVLIPAYVNNVGEVIQRKRTHDDSGDYPRTLILTRLPFYEDEKIAAFPDLTRLVTTSGKMITGEHPLLPSRETVDIMTEFVESLDLDKAQERETDFEGSKRIFNAMTPDQQRSHHDILVKDAIGIQRVNQVIKSIAMESSKRSGGLEEYCSTENIIPPMPEKTIIATHPPQSLQEEAQPLLARLEEALKTEKVEKARIRKRRVIEQAIEPDADDELSLEKLLMRGKRD